MSLSIRKSLGTDSGWLCIWNPERFLNVTDYDSWEDEVNLNDKCEQHVAQGDLIPISIASDGVWEFEVRVSENQEPMSLTDREKQLLRVSSQAYVFSSNGKLNISGAEFVEANFDSNHVGSLEIAPGNYEVTIHMINWRKEPNAIDSNAEISPNALPDFVILLNPIENPSQNYRTSLSTFDTYINPDQDDEDEE